jgi:hypothetical protein
MKRPFLRSAPRSNGLSRFRSTLIDDGPAAEVAMVEISFKQLGAYF